MKLALIMPRYSGCLANLIPVNTHMPLPTMTIIYQLCSALAECHRYGIIHCDVKCANVLFNFVSNDATTLNVYLSDFGISQVLIGSEKVDTRRNVRVKALSVAYAAPEVLEAAVNGDAILGGRDVVAISLEERKSLMLAVGDASPARDIYALSIIMWELVTRQQPYRRLHKKDVHQFICIDKNRLPVTDD